MAVFEGENYSQLKNLNILENFRIQGQSIQTSGIVFVQEAADLAGTLDSTKAYLIDGVIDMGTTQIRVPQGGITINGNGFDVSKLISSEDNYDMFIVDDTYSGNIFLTGLAVSVTGTSSRVHNLDNQENFGAVEWNDINFDNCTSLGVIDNYRQGLSRNVAFFNPSDGLEMGGAWLGGFAITDTIVINLPANTTLFKAGSGFLIGSSFRSDMNAISIDDTATVFDFAPSNFIEDGSFQLNNFRTNVNSNAIPNFPSTDVKALFKNCTGIRNTYRGGRWTISTAVQTVISAVDTLTKLEGTTTYNDLEWFQSNGDNSMEYLADLEIDVLVTGILSIDGTNNTQVAIQIRQWDDSAGSYIEVGPEFPTTLNGGAAGTRGENTSFQGIATLNEGDRIEIWVINRSNASNVTAVMGGDVIVSERAP